MILTQRSSRLFAPAFTFTPVPVGTPGASSTTTVQDGEYDTIALSSSHNNYLFSQTDFRGDTITYENETPEVCSVANWPLVERVATGTAKIVVSNGTARTRKALAFPATGSSTFYEFTGFTAATLSETLANEVLDRITEGKQDNFYLNYSASATSLALNENCWAAGIDLSARAINRNATAVTTRHIVGAEHWVAVGWEFRVGQVIKFRGSDGVIVSRTIIGTSYYGDCQVATLDAALPATVTPMQVASDWFARDVSLGAAVNGWGSATVNFGGIAFYLDQYMRCRFQLMGASVTPELSSRVRYATSVTIGAATINNRLQFGLCQGPSYFTDSNYEQYIPELLDGKSDFFASAIGGDSGSPVMLLVDDEPLFLGPWSYPNSFYAAWGEDFLDALIATSDTSGGVSTGLTVTVAPDPTA